VYTEQGSFPWPEGFAIFHRSSARQFPATNVKVALKVPSGLRCALHGGGASEPAQSGDNGEPQPRGWFGARGVGGGGQRGGSGGGCSSFEHRASFEAEESQGEAHLLCLQQPGSQQENLSEGESGVVGRFPCRRGGGWKQERIFA